jgi:uncharacterized protein YdeI (YjbR/CyaY-like superfamily)
MEPIFFKSQAELRKWFMKNHQKEKELVVGYYKTATGKPSVTWPQSVDEALCFGWIDGVRKSIDEESYMIRFTPRKPGSIWSAINIKKIEELTKQGLMQPAGLEAFAHRQEKKSKVYSYENEAVPFSPAFEKTFKANKKAWAYFQSQMPSYQKVATRWVMTAKQEATRQSRLKTLIADSEAERWLKHLSYGRKRKS